MTIEQDRASVVPGSALSDHRTRIVRRHDVIDRYPRP